MSVSKNRKFIYLDDRELEKAVENYLEKKNCDKKPVVGKFQYDALDIAKHIIESSELALKQQETVTDNYKDQKTEIESIKYNIGIIQNDLLDIKNVVKNIKYFLMFGFGLTTVVLAVFVVLYILGY